MNLSGWSDTRINCKVESIKNKGCKTSFVTEGGITTVHISVGEESSDYELRDFCNDDALAFRLMVDNQIMIDWYVDNGGYCSPFNRKSDDELISAEFKDENGISRAVSECFILMSRGGDK